MLAASTATPAAAAAWDISSSQDNLSAVKSAVMDASSSLPAMMVTPLTVTAAAALAKLKLDLSALADLPLRRTAAPEDCQLRSSSLPADSLTFGEKLSSMSGLTFCLRLYWIQLLIARTSATTFFQQRSSAETVQQFLSSLHTSPTHASAFRLR